MKKTTIYNKLPKLIKGVLWLSNGWLVGSAPNLMLSTDTIPPDYDIIVEDRQLYYKVVAMLAANSFMVETNSFGGTKFTNDRVEIDIWCEELGHFLQNGKQVGHIYSLRGDKVIQII